MRTERKRKEGRRRSRQRDGVKGGEVDEEGEVGKGKKVEGWRHI